ncbi:MAG: hypothetical protein L3J71_02645 [Victivallaceae bacterium]|nr:hypothetical protein [Victivallaceae bacterium]
MSDQLRYRQIHLDFHTSPHIPGIGEAFDKQKWQQTLKAGHVNSVTCFATCHHGMAYYDTSFGNKHPELTFDLLRAQFDACKEIDVNVPIYLTAGVNNWAAYEHPEWREVGCDGRYGGWTSNITDPGFQSMCFNSPYLDLLVEQIKEVAKLFPNCDGIFTDIIHQGQCCCKWCLATMEEQGLDAAKETDRLIMADLALEKYYVATTAAAKFYDSDMPIFHNSGHLSTASRDRLKYFNHFELESLPTGGWGYDHFPMAAKYCTQLDFDFLGMTGKFHTTWGEFGGYKHPNALRYECAAMIAMGAKCSVGDQLHPCGELDESTYNIIGAAYREVEEKEPWCDNVKSIADVGLLSSIAVNRSTARESNADTGAGRILLESHILFDVLDCEMDFAPYKLLVLADDLQIYDELKAKIDRYLATGGKLLLTGDSGLNADKSGFLWDIGAEFSGASEFSPDYVLPIPELQPEFTSSPMVMYMRANRIKVTTGRSLGKIYEPYFNRTFRHFSSHQHTPYKTEASEYDCGVLNGNILYLAHPIFSTYRGFGAVAYKAYCQKALKMLLDDDITVTSNLPSTARLTLNEQPEEQRYILHLLYANTINRGGVMELSGGNTEEKARTIEVIEELLPLHNTEVKLNLDREIKSVTLEPQGRALPYQLDNGLLTLKVDEFTCHQMIVLNYA